MTKSLDILLVSRKKDALESLASTLRNEGIATRQQLNSNGHVDPLYGVEQLPNVVILHLSQLWREELDCLIQRPSERRPALILVGAALDVTVMRLAMQAGARDVLPAPLSKSDLLEALARVAQDHKANDSDGRVSAFINAKGGCGATLLACNVAHMLTVESKKRTVLLDLDLQFGAAPLYFDLYPRRGVSQAIENLNEMDDVAFEGYLTRHASGLGVMSHAADEPVSSVGLPAAAADRLIDVALRGNDHLVIDLPRRAEPMTAAVLSRANQVVVVMQQSVTALRDAVRLLQWLRGDVGVPNDRLTVVVNRFDKNVTITTEDIQKSLSCEQPLLVPNDFQSASECVNTGTPLLSYARGAAITRALLTLQKRLGGSSAQAEGGLLMRTWSSLVGGRAR